MDDNKLRSKHRWRGKIFSNNEMLAKDSSNLNYKLDDDVVDFLHPKKTANPASLASPRLPPPRLDISSAQRWPGATVISHSPLTSGFSNLKLDTHHSKSGKSKRGLNVSFTSTAPEIIGEGGDEADLPSIEITRQKKPSPPRTQDDGALGLSIGSQSAGAVETPRLRNMGNDLSPRSGQLQRSKTTHGDNPNNWREKLHPSTEPPPPAPSQRLLPEPDFRPGPLRRTQTGFVPSSGQQMGLQTSATEGGGRLGPPRSLAKAERPTSFSEKLRSRMMDEEGRVFQEAFQTDSDSADDTKGPSKSPPHHQPNKPPATAAANKVAAPPSVPAKQPAAFGSAYSAYKPLQQERSRSSSSSLRNQSPAGIPTSTPTSQTASTSLYTSSPVRGMQTRRPSSPSGQARNGSPSSSVKHLRNYTSSPGTDSDYQSRISATRPEHELGGISNSAFHAGHRPSLAHNSLGVADSTVDDFAARVTHMKAIFRLTCELDGMLASFSANQWLRASLWWFLRGRADLEVMIRSRPRSSDGRPGSQKGDSKLMQPHVDVAKAWWILTDVIGSLPAVARYGDSPAAQISNARVAGDILTVEILESVTVVMLALKTLLFSMSKHQLMPPYQSLVQGQDQSIWIKYPKYAADVGAVLSNGGSRSVLADTKTAITSPLKLLPVGDSASEFCYGRYFVQVSVSTDEEDIAHILIPCILSILRGYSDLTLKITICSQNEFVNVSVQGERKFGPTWDDVRWNTKSHRLQIRLPRGFKLDVELSENDFKTLLGIFDYTGKVEMSMLPRSDERVVHEVSIRDFQYSTSNGPSPFPPEATKRCKARVFEKSVMQHEGGVTRRFHRGYRLVVVSSPKSRTLSYVSHDFGRGVPLIYEFRAGVGAEDGVAVIFRIVEKDRRCRMLLGLENSGERDALYSVLNGMSGAADETIVAQLPLQSLTVEELAPKNPSYSHFRDIMRKLKWRDAWVTNLEVIDPTVEHMRTIQSDNLRVAARHDGGSLTDWMNLGPGELKIRLDPSGSKSFMMLRQPQEDVTMSIDSGHQADSGLPESFADLLRILMASRTVRTYSFHSTKDLHAFQLAVTGFVVRYDGVASSFAIARRRMVVPIYKKLEAARARIQVVQQDNIVQLLAFFEDFGPTDSMNFQMKSMDVIEQSEKSGKATVRLVDAKFALPNKEERSPDQRFICLDLPEYPGEHDDITIGFDSASERDRFVSVLPAAPQLSRAVTFRRKI